MDRNDYYGGESTSLNLVQVISLNLGHDSFVLFVSPICLIELICFSFGRGLKEVINLQLNWVLVEITMLT